MEIDFNGTPATIDIPEGYIALDALILVRAVNMNNPAEGIVSIGSTDHTDPHHPRRHRLILRKVPDDDRSARRGRLAVWATARTNYGATVVPLNDSMAHEKNANCACGPTWEPVALGNDATWLLTHHSLDGRENTE